MTTRPSSKAGTVVETVPNSVTASDSTASPHKQKEMGTVGTVFPYCTRRARGNDNERARGDFPETGPQLSPTVPAPDSLIWFDIHRCDSVLGVGKRLERIKAASRDAAQKIGEERHGKHILVTLASNAKPIEQKRRARDLGNTRRTR